MQVARRRAAVARCLFLLAALSVPAFADPHDDLVKEVQRRCDDTRSSYDPVNCQAIGIEAADEFRGEAGTGNLGLLRAPDASRRLGAVMLVLGFSQQASESCASNDEFDPNVVQGGQRAQIEDTAELWQMGFDVYSLDWCDKNDLIQRNALVLIEALEQVREGSFPSDVAPLGEDESLIVIGASMGGLVSRYALASLEDDGVDHGVDLFISFDAPQEGAYLPIGIQHLAELLDIGPAIGATAARVFNRIKDLIEDEESETIECDGKLEELLCQLRGAETPAARQMLLVHKDGPRTSGPTEDFEELFDELDRLGYPDADGLRTVAIANGSGGGEWTRPPLRSLRFHSGEERKKTLRFQFPKDPDDSIFDSVLWEGSLRLRTRGLVEIIVSPLDQANTTMTVMEARLNIPGLYINDTYVTPTGIGRGFIKDLLEIPDELPVDVILNPAVQTVRDAVDSLINPDVLFKIERRANVPVAYATVSAGTATRFKEAEEALTALNVSGGAELDPFIPTTSALGLNRDEFPAHTDVARLEEAGGLETPFDAVYYHNRETTHTETTDAVRRWLCDEATALTASPTITALHPAKRPVGGATFLLEVEGANLTDELTLVWDNPSSEETVDLKTARRGDTLLAEVPAELIDELPPCRDGFCNPLFPEFEPIFVSIRNTVTHVPGCRPLRFALEENRVTTVPATPVSREPFTLTLSDDWRNGCVPQAVPVPDGARPYERDGNVFTIRTTTGPPEQNCTFALTAYEIDTPLEPLPAGSYQAVYTVEDGGQMRELARYPFIVRTSRPMISTLEPPVVAAMPEGDVELTISGSGFVEGVSKIFWDEREQTTVFIDQNTLRTTIPAEELAEAGSIEITVESRDDAGMFASEPARLTVTEPVLEAISLSLAEIPLGEPDTTVVVAGRGFTPDSAAAWPIGDEQLTALETTFLGPTELAVVVPAERARTAGTFVIVIVDGESETSIPIVVASDEPLVSDLPRINGVTDAAAFRTVASPLGFATIFGVDFAATEFFASGLPLPYELGGVEITVDGIPAAIQYVSPTQINFQIPGGVTIGGTVQVVVIRDGLPGDAFELPIAADAFGVFSFVRAPGTPDQSVDPIIVDAEGAILSPDNSAGPGDILVVYGTGVSSLNNAPGDAEASPSDPPSTCAATPTVTVRTDRAEAPVDVLYCGLTANLVSLVQLNLRLTARPEGDDPMLFVRFGEAQESPGVPLYFEGP